METHGLFPIRITAFPRKKEEKRMKLTKNDWFGAGKWMGLKLELIFGLGLCLLSMALGNVAGAQAISTTTVQGTVYLANGQVGAGTLMLRWPAFTTANGQSVAADSITVTIAPGQSFNLTSALESQLAAEVAQAGNAADLQNIMNQITTLATGAVTAVESGSLTSLMSIITTLNTSTITILAVDNGIPPSMTHQ